MATILGKCQQRLLERIAAVCRIGTMFEEKLRDLAVTFTHREVNWRRVGVLDRGKRRRARYEPLYRSNVALARRGEHGEDIVGLRHRSIGKRPTPTSRELYWTNEWSQKGLSRRSRR